jgi:hypothetical protein
MGIFDASAPFWTAMDRDDLLLLLTVKNKKEGEKRREK